MSSRHLSLNRRQLLQYAGLGASALAAQQLLAGCAVNPVTGENQFMMISEQQEVSIDKQQSPFQFSNDYGITQDSRLNAYVNRVGQEVASRSHRPRMPYSFSPVNAAYINAYAFPEGTRSHDGQPAPLQHRALKLARLTKAPLEVFRIDNTNVLFPPGRFLFCASAANTIRVTAVGCIQPQDPLYQGPLTQLEEALTVLLKGKTPPTPENSAFRHTGQPSTQSAS